MRTVDLNADLGEADTPGWARAEQAMLTYISSANIACGGHAGTPHSMAAMVRGSCAHNVVIGAHPAYPDPAHFGRRSLSLGTDITPAQLCLTLLKQITDLAEIAAQHGRAIAYVKPHGALYNDAVKDPQKADILRKPSIY